MTVDNLKTNKRGMWAKKLSEKEVSERMSRLRKDGWAKKTKEERRERSLKMLEARWGKKEQKNTD